MTSAHVIHEPDGTITVAPSVLEQVVQRTAELTDGVRVMRPRRRLDVDVDGDRARVAVALAVRYGCVLPEVAADVQRRVADAVETICGLRAAVDVQVEEVE
jgi:uncharacterized alkaline shock family protein YloU